MADGNRSGGRRRPAVLAGAAAAGALVLGGGWAGPAHAAPTCAPAGPSGLTAAMIVTAGQTVTSQTVDGTGCDIGIYLAPGTSNVTLDTVTVSGANVHGIYGQDVTGIVIQNSTVQNNGLKPNQNINEQKAIELDGVTNSTVKNNTVQNNFADGGIGIDDDGPNSPGAINGGSATPVKSANVTVSGNNLPNNYGGCDIVVAAYNAGGGLDHITVTANTIPGHPGQFDPNAGPFIGQIVIANDFPGNAITNTTITNNTITGSALAGIVLHANAPDDTETNTVISSNTISLNHWLTPFGPPQLTGIAIQAEGGPPGHQAAIDSTLIRSNTISNQYYGIWTKGIVTNLGITPDNNITGATQAVFNKPDPFSGYTLVGSDGGAFTYGHAVYSGSAASSHPAVKIVGAAQTRDDNGWWMAGSDGSVYDIGDATAVGSLPLIHVTPKAPIVGIAATRPGGGHGGPGPNGIGFYLVGADGGVFNFGDAGYMGSLGNLHLNSPIVGMAVTADDGGYYLVGADGGVFTFGDAPYLGSLGNKHLNAPIVGMAESPTGAGYTLVAADGGVFTFGDAQYYGSTGNMHLNKPIVGIDLGPSLPGAPGPMGPEPTPAGGYALVASDGGVFTFGRAPFYGSAGNVKLVAPVVGMSYTG